MSFNIDLLRQKAKLNISENIFSKDELKTIFIFNYGGKNNLNLAPLLNNNMTYQCFRNAAFYLMSRLELDIWETIDTLPITTSFVAITSTADKNKYIIIQTFIELMDDKIIDNTVTNSKYNNINKKRTYFIDKRFDMLNDTSNPFKYHTYGVLENPDSNESYKPSYYAPRENGGTSETVIIKLNSFLKGDSSTCIYTEENSMIDLSKCTTLTNPNYIILKLKSEKISMNDFFSNISNNRTQIFNTNLYRLVGITYDCPNGVPHQVTSICRGMNCIDSPPKHNFLDDKDDKGLLDLKNTVYSNLNWGCKYGGINITAVLYEREGVYDILNSNVSEFISKNTFIKSTVNLVPNLEIDYKNKYKKYKNKYLKLKSLRV